jgi:hypothetical protein
MKQCAACPSTDGRRVRGLCLGCYEKLRARGMLPSSRRRQGKTRSPSGAIACAEAMGITRQHATVLLKTKKIVFVDNQFVRTDK